MSIAIISGASRGFGRALATDLVHNGWTVIVDGRDRGRLHELAEASASGEGEVCDIAGDITDPEHRAALVRAAELLGGLDLLVNNASKLGPTPLPTLEHLPLDELRRIYEVNVIAPLGLLQLALPLLRRSDGTIVSLSSDAATEAYEGWGGYGSSKAALDQLQRVFSVEQAALRAYEFDPGDMRTDMQQQAFPGEDISDRPPPESVVPALRRLLASGAPNGRYRASEWQS